MQASSCWIYRALSVAIACLPLLAAPAAVGGESFCQPTFHDCTDDKCACSAQGTSVYDPIDIATGNTIFRHLDAEVEGTINPLKLLRTYTSYSDSWSDDVTRLTPTPFGTPAGSGLAWWHNYYSYVDVFPTNAYFGIYTYLVHNANGRVLTYNSCTPPCWAQNHETINIPDRLYVQDAGGSSMSFQYFTPENRQYVYSTGPVLPEPVISPDESAFFLTRIVDVSGNTVATVNYRYPIGSDGGVLAGCDGGGAAGVPYVGTVENEDGALLDFRYAVLDAGYPACVVASVLLGNVSSSAAETTQATYTYVGSQPSSLASASVVTPGGGFSTDDYSYGSGFEVQQASTITISQVQGGCSAVASASIPAESPVVFSWGGTGDSCAGTDSSYKYCGAIAPFEQFASYPSVTPGNGSSAADGGYTRQYDVLSVGIGPNDDIPMLASYSDTCGVSGACSAGTWRRTWACSGPPIYYPLAEEDKRGDFEVHPGVLPPALPLDAGWPHEIAGLQIGATTISYDGGVPAYPACQGLECDWYGYSYGPTNIEQRLATDKRLSVVETSDMAETFYAFDGGPTGNFPASTIKEGWLADGGATFIGTFQYPYCPSCGTHPVDPLYRVLEKDGPCFVSSSTATACPSGTTFPITEYAYYGSTGDLRASRLETTTTYPAGSGGTALTTTYNTYDVYGNATSITDPAGVTTTYAYTNNLLTQKVVDPSGADLITNYGYDQDKLTSIEYPGGNYETFCYRSGSTSTCNTSSGTYTPLLQWRSKSANANGSSFSEQVQYAYNGDGTVSTESFYDSGGNLRRERQYQKDNQKRPTWEAWGSSPAYSEIRAFDGSDNLAGIGLPFNSAPAFCGTSESSTSCELLSSDAANRLTKVTEYPSSGGSAVNTQLAYDTDGNVCAVTVNASGSWTKSCTNTGASDDATTAYYQYDDFGNLLTAKLPDTGTSSKGTITYTYDALGDPLTKTLSDGSVLSYSYDAMGRLLSASEGSYVAYDLSYDAATPPSGCSSLTYASGRLAERVDSFGATYYSYDVEGRVLSEQRVRLGATACTAASSGVNPDANPTTVYSYNGNGDLLTITYPHGREVAYTYGTGGLSDRVATVSVYLWSGSAWSSTEILQSVTWEPYGGLRAYQMDFASSAYGSVEYFAGASGTEPAATCAGVSGTTLGTNDDTGLLRAIGVSSGALSLGDGTGDIANLFYTWQADQVKVRDLCVTDGGTPHRETFNPSDFAYNPDKPGYDQLLRVEHAEMPYRATVGGAYNERDFGCTPSGSTCSTLGYDGRGNRLTPEAINAGDGGATLAYTYDGGAFQPDELVEVASQAASSEVGYWYSYDADGRVASKAWHTDSSGSPAHELSWAYGLAWGLDGGSSSIENIKTVTIQDGTSSVSYNYYYDAFNRRRFKAYPTAGVSDEYFYDLGHQMLEERGSNSVSSSAPYPEDDYVWLDGRPVAYVRGQISSTWTRNADSTATCGELGDGLPCGVYFVVTDHLGKPTVALNDSRQVVGVYDYDIFGALNRYGYEGDTAHPYSASTGTTSCTTNTAVIADVTERPIASGMSVDLRTRMHLVDTEGSSGSPTDYAMVRDGDEATCLVSSIGGEHDGANVSAWVTPDAGHIQVSFYSNASSSCPDGGTCQASCSGTCPYPYTGVSMEAVDYRQYQTGTTPLLLPIRFPGQYYDGETDLNENWNRFYDPSVGRYLETEPALLDPNNTVIAAEEFATFVPSYSYAADNPITNVDPDGLGSFNPGSAQCQELRKLLDDLIQQRNQNRDAPCGPGTKDHQKKADQIQNRIDKLQAKIDKYCSDQPSRFFLPFAIE